MNSIRKTVVRVFLGVVVSLALGFGGVSLSPAMAGTLEPPGSAVDGSGDPIPEPSTILLFGTGLAGLAAWRLRKQQVG